MYEPVVLWAEIGDDDFECRKVDEFRDGRLAYADGDTEMGSTWLSDQPIPSVDSINQDEEFAAVEVDRADFEVRYLGMARDPPSSVVVRPGAETPARSGQASRAAHSDDVRRQRAFRFSDAERGCVSGGPR